MISFGFDDDEISSKRSVGKQISPNKLIRVKRNFFSLLMTQLASLLFKKKLFQ